MSAFAIFTAGQVTDFSGLIKGNVFRSLSPQNAALTWALFATDSKDSANIQLPAIRSKLSNVEQTSIWSGIRVDQDWLRGGETFETTILCKQDFHGTSGKQRHHPQLNLYATAATLSLSRLCTAYVFSQSTGYFSAPDLDIERLHLQLGVVEGHRRQV